MNCKIRSWSPRVLRALVLFILSASAQANEQPIIEYDQPLHPVIGKQGMVASQEKLASQIGLDILKRGGNAVDAAVAVGYALAVTLPRAGNIGGGGFMLVYMKDQNKTIAIDYREAAPLSATEDMFVDEKGKVDKAKARSSYLSSGVPGTVAGLNLALKKYGSMSLDEVLEPAIRLAESGIRVSYDLSGSLKSRAKRLKQSKAAAKIFLKGDSFYEYGDVLKQSDLAWSLKQIKAHGTPAFYRGEIAKKIAADMKQHGGLISLQDLARYKAVEREPVRGEFYGFRVVSMPPPSSGGIHLVQMLNMLQLLNIKGVESNTAQYYHLLTEVMKRAYADRSRYLGDPDFYPVPLQGLASRAYAQHLVNGLSRTTATPAKKIRPGDPARYESNETTHYSVMDRWGNAVANTYTLNFSYGNGKVVAGTGILMNNEMDDFSAKKGVANAFGLIGGEANAISPTKRPLSSMTPTIVLSATGDPFLVLGSPGGSTIITIVLQNILNVLVNEQNLATAVTTPRIHHQWLPDTLFVEPGISPDSTRILESMGHKVRQRRTMGSVQAIMWKAPFFYGFSDPRRPGAATLGF